HSPSRHDLSFTNRRQPAETRTMIISPTVTISARSMRFWGPSFDVFAQRFRGIGKVLFATAKRFESIGRHFEPTGTSLGSRMIRFTRPIEAGQPIDAKGNSRFPQSQRTGVTRPQIPSRRFKPSVNSPPPIATMYSL